MNKKWMLSVLFFTLSVFLISPISALKAEETVEIMSETETIGNPVSEFESLKEEVLEIDKSEIPKGVSTNVDSESSVMDSIEEETISEEEFEAKNEESEEIEDALEEENEEEKDTKKKETKKKKKKSASKEKDKKAIISFTDEEFRMLACVIYLEAGNQPFKGKVAVGNIVINRVKSKGFPNTIHGVLHHKLGNYYQFSLAKPGGALYKALAVYGKRSVRWQRVAEKESIKAAKATLYGERYIPENLCFYMAKNRSIMRRKPVGKVIKDHYFYQW